ncbi:TPA: hypothetical protein PTV74_003131 [Clostridium botulinum]|nr:hypothetical protein [Clostridium botulinum]HDK7206286.1 hypothetical protein [Clostridium botulinum]HDK7210022.1 hypothetical protein [Clostridium botulinum]HDK7265471.1 hypothetical protein [Clostridium botulinum]HDK7269319.1 hypothetical protein [Clostridium botulinum]
MDKEIENIDYKETQCTLKDMMSKDLSEIFIQLANFKNTISEVLIPIFKGVYTINTFFTESMKVIIKELSDKKKKNIYFATIFLEMNPKFSDKFIIEGMFPPIFYFLDSMGDNEFIEFDESYINKIDINNIINDPDIKKYYIKAIDNWIDEEHTDCIRDFIKEIKTNFMQNKIYSTTLNLFTLIEYKVRESGDNTDKPIGERKIFRGIRKVLKENCFKYNNSKELEKLYSTFFNEESEYNIYKSTSDKPKIITRHILHGDRLDLINKKNMMSLVFLTDCLYRMLIKNFD